MIKALVLRFLSNSKYLSYCSIYLPDVTVYIFLKGDFAQEVMKEVEKPFCSVKETSVCPGGVFCRSGNSIENVISSLMVDNSNHRKGNGSVENSALRYQMAHVSIFLEHAGHFLVSHPVTHRAVLECAGLYGRTDRFRDHLSGISRPGKVLRG